MASLQQDSKQIHLQAKLFDFSIAELVRQHRESFEPLWTVDSWAKFLIWMTLNCGMSGERKSLEEFADAIGAPLTSRIRRIFFQRNLDNFSLQLFADPAEPKVLLMPINATGTGNGSILENFAEQALDQVGLSQRVVIDRSKWKSLESLLVIPWQESSIDTFNQKK